MADERDDDATRIYRPYGSPPPDEPASDDPSGEAPRPDPFAADPFAPEPPADPFAPDPSPAADPFAAEPAPEAPPAADPFAPDPAPAQDPFRAPADRAPAGGAPAPDPFAPQELAAPDPFAPEASVASDPFAPEASAAPDPFAPPPAETADPFAPATPSAAEAPDPFAPAPSQDPFSTPPAPPAPDPFAPPPPAADTSDPFRAPAADPFAGSADPFGPPAEPARPAPPEPDPFAPRPGPDPFDVTPADPFAVAPALPATPQTPDHSPDPFASTPSTTSSDPFADLAGPSAGGAIGSSFDSGFHEVRHGGTEVELPKAFGTEQTLAGSFTPVFSLILQIRAAQDLGDPTALRQRIESLLGTASRDARTAGARDKDVDEATFALVAFLDEAILAQDWSGRDAWSAQPLQLTHYDRYDLGERFFDRLKALLDEGGQRKELLEVYYLCLSLGFKGRYAIQGREVLRRLIDDLYDRLSQSREPRGLSPRGTSREVPAEAEKGGIPTWALWVGAAVLVALLYLGLSLSLNSAAEDTGNTLETISADP